MRSIDREFGHASRIGSGVMFLFAACLNFAAFFFALSLPKDRANSRQSTTAFGMEEDPDDYNGPTVPLPLLSEHDLNDILI
jgi:hypothetical protein